MSGDAGLRTDPAHHAPGDQAPPSGRTTYRAPARVLDLVGLVARLVLGGVLVAAGLPKVTDLTGSVQNVLAYELFDYGTARLIGTVLPVLEIALGVLLVLGLLTRAAAAAGGLLMVVFIAGIVSAWSRGLAIDCGCFGTGGPVDPEETTYLVDIVRDLVLLALAAWLVVRPRTPLALDTLLTKGR
jgi:uncharacterized membrane protein YphA (DoxX/SURF4 family)